MSTISTMSGMCLFSLHSLSIWLLMFLFLCFYSTSLQDAIYSAEEVARFCKTSTGLLSQHSAYYHHLLLHSLLLYYSDMIEKRKPGKEALPGEAMTQLRNSLNKSIHRKLKRVCDPTNFICEKLSISYKKLWHSLGFASNPSSPRSLVEVKDADKWLQIPDDLIDTLKVDCHLIKSEHPTYRKVVICLGRKIHTRYYTISMPEMGQKAMMATLWLSVLRRFELNIEQANIKLKKELAEYESILKQDGSMSSLMPILAQHMSYCLKYDSVIQKLQKNLQSFSEFLLYLGIIRDVTINWTNFQLPSKSNLPSNLNTIRIPEELEPYCDFNYVYMVDRYGTAYLQAQFDDIIFNFINGFLRWNQNEKEARTSVNFKPMHKTEFYLTVFMFRKEDLLPKVDTTTEEEIDHSSASSDESNDSNWTEEVADLGGDNSKIITSNWWIFRHKKLTGVSLLVILTCIGIVLNWWNSKDSNEKSTSVFPSSTTDSTTSPSPSLVRILGWLTFAIVLLLITFFLARYAYRWYFGISSNSSRSVSTSSSTSTTIKAESKASASKVATSVCIKDLKQKKVSQLTSVMKQFRVVSKHETKKK